ncbi:MAG: ThiF family adenylyltransferase [Anaplasmataceae bacterium]|nr:ThiF family adenylyltransferase [Anaplasmataceae bacterium]
MIYLIGCGGVGSYLLPALYHSTKEIITLIDGDVVEEKNYERQNLEQHHIRENKASVMARSLQFLPKRFTVIPEYITVENFFPERKSIIFCCVDNHPARRVCLQKADDYQCKVILCANEYESAQAYLYLPEWKDTIRDYRIKYPDVLTDNRFDPTKVGCNEVVESFPQLAIFNNLCAALGLQLFHIVKTKQFKGTTAIGFEGNYNKINIITYGTNR